MFSFAKRKKIVDVYPYIRRLCDLTAPNLLSGWEKRSENRYNRAIPTLLGPWQDGCPIVDECVMGITSDLADRGVGLIFDRTVCADSVVIGYSVPSSMMPESWFFLGNIRRNRAIGGGFWAIGIELTEFANTNYSESLAVLRPLAAKLRASEEPATD